jgi:hypothetical protein
MALNTPGASDTAVFSFSLRSPTTANVEVLVASFCPSIHLPIVHHLLVVSALLLSTQKMPSLPQSTAEHVTCSCHQQESSVGAGNNTWWVFCLQFLLFSVPSPAKQIGKNLSE